MPDLNERIMNALVEGRDEEQAKRAEKVDSWLNAETPIDFEEAIKDLAELNYEGYVKRRKAAARRLEVTGKNLDVVVARRRPKVTDGEGEGQGQLLVNEPDVPWEAEVEGATLLEEISKLVQRYIYFTPERITDPDTVALFILGSYCFDAFSKFPFLGISAAGEDSGKTTLGKCVYRLSYKPTSMNNVTPAALFRLIEVHKGTLVIDEMDTFLDEKSELYGILNSGHDKEMAYVVRTVGDEHEPRRFATWCPKVWIMIGLPKRTITSRSLVIRLLRAPVEMKLEELPNSDQLGEEWKRIRRQCTRWAQDHKTALHEASTSKTGMSNRKRDNWAPLFIIAEHASWRERVKKAADLPSVQSTEDPNITLLRDLRNIFFTRKASRLPATVIAADLGRQQESPWPFYENTNRPITPCQVGMLLGKLNIHSQPFKVRKEDRYATREGALRVGTTVRGYNDYQFKELIDSYLTGETAEEVPIYHFDF